MTAAMPDGTGIAKPLAKGRHLNMRGDEAVIEVGAEMTLLDAPSEVLPGGGNQAYALGCATRVEF